MSRRPDRLYCQDIIESGEAIISYVSGLDLEDFKRDRLRYSAVIREFEIIGEAVGKLSPELKASAPHVPWQDIKDFRNLLIHEYFGVDLEIIWNTVQDDLPALIEAVKGLSKSS